LELKPVSNTKGIATNAAISMQDVQPVVSILPVNPEEIGPQGKKFRSKPQLARYLGEAVDLTSFDFRTGKINSLLLRKSKRQRGSYDYSRGGRADTNLVPPIRQTASIFKQPVTVIKTQESKVKTDFKHGPQEKPKQLFWEKRLQDLRACDMDEEEFRPVELPSNLKPVGPNVHDDTLLQSVATALHVSNQPITGQMGNRLALEKNPGVYINPDQPLVQAVVVTEEDIRSQEDKVQSARRRLEQVLQSINVPLIVQGRKESQPLVGFR
jgi:methyl-CpG-binding domain protein 2